MTPRTSCNDYERTPIPPPTATTIKTNAGYDEIYEKHSRVPPKVCLSSIDDYHFLFIVLLGGISSTNCQSTTYTRY